MVLTTLTPSEIQNGGSEAAAPAPELVKGTGIKLNIGDLIVQFLNLLIVLAVISYALPYMKSYVPVAGSR